MKPNKQNVIDEILIELEKGINYTDCLVLNGSKWFKPKTTFTRLWKEAQNQYDLKHQIINNEIIKEEVENKKELLKKANLTKIDRVLIAEKIAMGKIKNVNGVKLRPTFADQLKALDYLAKVNSDYSPVKTESEININSNIDISKLSDEALEELEKAYTNNSQEIE